MYNSHRGMVPAPNNRLTELLDQVRVEFENQQARSGEYEHKSMSIFYNISSVTTLENWPFGSLINTAAYRIYNVCFANLTTVQQQTGEMDLVRQTVFQLEAAHASMKLK